MTKKIISDSVSNISTRHIEEAADYSAKRKAHKPIWIKLGAIAACLALVFTISGILFPFGSGVTVAAYAYETNEEITTAGAVMSAGMIDNSGELSGHPLMFFLSGKDIETVRFSCKNQMINFTDLTEKRDEYGNGQNFTVPYGKNESEYYFLLIDWIPVFTIRELINDTDSTISTLPYELREDIIVMEITFANGKKETKAIRVSLLDDGTFFATFDDGYTISEEDDFINRPDSEAIPRDILYGNTEFTATFYDKEQNEVQEEALWYNLADADNILVEWTGMTPNTVRLFYTPAGTETAEQTQLLMTKVPLDGDSKVILSLSELDKTELHGHFQIELTYGTKKDTIDYNVLYDSDYESHSNQPENENSVDAIFSVSKKYLEDKGLVVEEASLLEYTWTNAVTEMLVSKDGVVEQTARKLILEFHENTWEVIREE